MIPNKLRPHLLLILLALAAYGSALTGSEYCYDEKSMIKENAGPGDWANLGRVFSKDFVPLFGDLRFRPVAQFTYFVDVLVLGKTVWASRLINLLLHLANGLLLFGLWRRVFQRETLPFLAATLFLVHPLASEAVICAGFRRDLLATLFLILTVRLLWDGVLEKRRVLCFGAAGLWLLGLLSKETAVVAVALAPVLLIWRRRLIAHDRPLAQRRVLYTGEVRGEDSAGVSLTSGETRGRSLYFAPLVAAFVFVFAVWLSMYVAFRPAQGFDQVPQTSQAMRFDSSSNATAPLWPEDFGAILRFLNFSRSLVVYLRLWFFPVGLSIHHYAPPIENWRHPELLFSVALLALLIVLFSRYLRRGEPAGLGAWWALVCLVPLCQIIPTPELVAERYVYTAHAGVSLALAAAILKIARNFVHLVPVQRSPNPAYRRLRGNPKGRALVVAIVLVLIALSFQRGLDWRSDARLHLRAYELWDNPEGWMRQGILHFAEERRDEAQWLLERAVDENPCLADAWRALALIHWESGDRDRGRDFLDRALVLDPDNPLNQRTLDFFDSKKLR